MRHWILVLLMLAVVAPLAIAQDAPKPKEDQPTKAKDDDKEDEKPESLDDLKGPRVATSRIDPFTGKDMRLRAIEKVRIPYSVGPDGVDVPPGEAGELWARGPNIMKGYFRKPEATALVLQDGWLNTGDLVFEDESGSINIAGRTKELIIRSGFNVYPPEVEGVLSSHPDVSVAAVVGRMVGSDEEIVAFLQPVPGSSIDIDSLKAFARERLAGYKLPGRFVVMNELPAAPSGKILKHKLELPA